MKMIIVALALVALVAAAPVEKESPKIIRSEYDQQSNGAYSYQFESEDGISKSEVAEVKEVLDEDNKPQLILVIRGSFSYPRNDGGVETINYVADENGFRAEGPSIPQPPAPASK
ncbi:larval cuticle protein 1-like [Danaus plexippus]|uniref:larval cuticle protein 1-like n=1 Tax=Danaus plexippus TaxID=13037 RepID=UPI0013C4F4B9|nr:larval cuticle protein 1-like [Danaus plexippus]